MKREKTIKIRMSEKEKNIIEKRACENNLTVSRYMRETALGTKKIDTKKEVVISACAYIAYWELINYFSKQYGIEYDEIEKKGEAIWEKYISI